MTREEIISQLESEINLLLRARDTLAAPLGDFMKVAPRKLKPKPAEKIRKAPEVVVAPVVMAAPPPPPPPLAPEPQVRRVPPKRRMERRQVAEKPGKSAAALSGHVPSGPVAVSADEARKVQVKSAPAPAVAASSELRPEGGTERTLGSLIQAFERRAGLSGLEIP